MNGNGFGHGEPGEHDDAPAEPLPLRRPGQGRHTFSPLRFESNPPQPGYPETQPGYPETQPGYPETGPGFDNGYRTPYGAGNGNGNGYGYGYAVPPESGNGQLPPGPYPSQLPPTPYGAQPGPYPSPLPYGPRTIDQSSFDLRAADTNGGGSSSVLSRYGYDPGAPTYGDSPYARSRSAAGDLEIRPGVGGRHARPDTAEPRRPRKRAAPAATADGERRHMPLWQELPLLLVVAFCLAVLIRSFLLQAFFIPSSSMEATLLVGDRVLVNKVIYDLRDPEHGEIVVFRGTDKWAPENFVEPPGGVMSRIGRTMGDLVGVSRPGEKDFIKRVIGLPGDHVACCDPEGRVMVNGVGIDEPYIDVNSSLDVPFSPGNCGSRRFDELVVPQGQIFVMGDNRIVSQDSRCQGPVPIENVIGRAFVIVWPSGRWDGLSVPDTFNGVPRPAALAPAQESPAPVGAAIVTLPILATLVGSTWGFDRRGRNHRSRPRRLRE
jgi:signal peptidase I